MNAKLVSIITCSALVLSLGACEITDAMRNSSLTVEPETEIATGTGDNQAYRAAMSLGAASIDARQKERAIAAFQQASGLKPDDPDSLLALAEAAIAGRDFEKAIQAINRVDKLNGAGTDGRLEQAKGVVAFHTGRLEDAMVELSAAVRLDSSHWRAWTTLGRAHMRKGNVDEARSAFTHAARHAPEMASARNDIGMTHLITRDPHRAIEQFERAIALDPDFELARANMRIARAMLKDYQTAIAGTVPSDLADVLNNVGYLAMVNGDYEVADSYLRRAVEHSPTYHAAAVANLDLLSNDLSR